MIFKKFEDMTVWREGRELVKAVYALTRTGSFAKDWGLRDQIQRAAVSICSNIAEGFERRGNKEFIKFLWIAKGSAAEVSSQLYHALDLGYIEKESFMKVYDSAKLVGGMIFNLIRAIDNTKGSNFIRA